MVMKHFAGAAVTTALILDAEAMTHVDSPASKRSKTWPAAATKAAALHFARAKHPSPTASPKIRPTPIPGTVRAAVQARSRQQRAPPNVRRDDVGARRFPFTFGLAFGASASTALARMIIPIAVGACSF